MKHNEILTDEFSKYLSAITKITTKIDCEFSIDEDGYYVSNNIIEQTGIVGQQMFRTIFLKYDIRRFYRYVVFGSFYYYELLNGDCYGYKLKDYIYDTEKEQFLLNDAEKKQAEQEILNEAGIIFRT